MKQTIIILFITLLFSCKNESKFEHYGCNFYGDSKVSIDLYSKNIHSFSSNSQAEKIIDEIVNISGLESNFIIAEESRVENAAALVANDKRYIFYNKYFIEKINNITNSDWAAISILAHEIGHHLQGHTISDLGSRPQQELEADKFSGFILNLMGASLGDAQIAIRKVAPENESRTHPARSKRLNAILEGFNNASKRMNKQINTDLVNSQDNSNRKSNKSSNLSLLKDRKPYEYKFYFNKALEKQIFPPQVSNQSEYFSNIKMEISDKLIRIEDKEIFNQKFDFLIDRDFLRIEDMGHFYNDNSEYIIIATNLLPEPGGGFEGKLWWASVVSGISGFIIYKDGNLVAQNLNVSSSGSMGGNQTNLKKLKIISNTGNGSIIQVGENLFIALNSENEMSGINIPKYVTDGSGFMDDPVVIERKGIKIKGNDILVNYLDVRDDSPININYNYDIESGIYHNEKSIYSYRNKHINNK